MIKLFNTSWFAVIVYSVLAGAGARNTAKLKYKCRTEDGYLRCQDGTCQLRSVQVLETCQLGMNCTNDELACRGFNRCIPRSLVGTDDGCIFGKKGSTRLPCKEDEFTCLGSRLCLARHQVRDGQHDCNVTDLIDESDELVPLPECRAVEFQCQDDTERCIPREWVLDGADDCSGMSDELQPLSICLKSEFRCENGQCIARYRVQDGFTDCKNGSDEYHGTQSPLSCVEEQEFKCKDSGRCIPRSWVMDGISNCKDSSDERTQLTCLDTEFTCLNEFRCLPMKYVCDGMDHCGDCSDEIEGCEEPRMWRCPNDTSICIQQSYACDGFIDCPGGKDNPEYLPGFKCTKAVLTTSTTQCVIPQWTLRDDFAICEDKSDVCYDESGALTCSKCAFKDYIIASRQICDGFVDCHDLTDECICRYQDTGAPEISLLCDSICYSGLSSPACDLCDERQLLCWLDNKCISLDLVCNGVIDCPLSETDEHACVDTPIFTTNTQVAEANFKCWQLDSDILEFAEHLSIDETYLQYFRDNATRCNGVIECARFEDECDAGCDKIPKECDEIPLVNIQIFFIYNLQLRSCKNFYTDFNTDYTDYLLPESFCNGIAECPGGEDEFECDGRHRCDAGVQELPTGAKKKRISIELDKVCDKNFDCLDQSDETNCNSSSHFYCEGGNPLFIDAKKVLNGVQDCDDNSDECPSNIFADSPLSSREHLISSPVLQVFVWIMAVVSILGNLFVGIENAFLSRLKSDSPISQCSRTIITNLALADLLMGIALIMIGSKSASTAGSYCENDKTWRTSQLCSAIGVLTVLSSEMSVLCLVALTCYRLYGIFRPFDGLFVKPRRAVILVLVLWIIALILSIFPLIPVVNQTMVTEVLIAPSQYFDNTIVTWENFRTFAGRLYTLVPRNESTIAYDISSWKTAIESTSLHYSDIAPQVAGHFGYYSTDGVCIPRLFRLQGTGPLHPLTLFITSLNFVCLIFIIASYILIYWRSTRNIANSSNTNGNRSTTMQKKISVLIATDLCCWLPICIMAFMSQSEMYISKSAYAFAAVILLPINSSLNPIIYSRGFSQLRKFIGKEISKLLKKT